ncbi:LysR family transcriptional regulator [Novosphingobium sp. YJ-S2-02]|uniref:LysR family transcriptional regulator n=1 Tax=Novosphingobium aureum TaxID=2792964 RepID=A0A931HDQ4_9SPHN|nr:LysR family transcriptional regulator [Novosphingobium aureum]MBH0114106.1 LysR family transcriptional regulator [Novosphingobium aureum]
MDIRQLERFVAVALSGSFNRAAEALAVSQPSLTRSIQLLEAGLEQALFERGARGISLTGAGRELLPRAQLIIAERDRALAAVQALSGRAAQTVVIGCDAAFAMQRIPEALSRMAHSHPQVRMAVREGALADMLEALRAGQVNLVFAARAPGLDIGELVFEQLAMESAGVIMRADHPLARQGRTSLTDLAGARWIVPEHPVLESGWRRMFEECDLPAPPIALQTSSLGLVKGCLLAGPFVSLGDRSSFAQEIDSGRLVALDLGLSRYERPTGLFRRPEARLTQAELALVTILRAICKTVPG